MAVSTFRERFPAKWTQVGVKKTRQKNKPEPDMISIRTALPFLIHLVSTLLDSRREP